MKQGKKNEKAREKKKLLIYRIGDGKDRKKV